jgi:hypothetical protein
MSIARIPKSFLIQATYVVKNRELKIKDKNMIEIKEHK